MARIARIVFPGIPHHVTQRGNRRLPIFFPEIGIASPEFSGILLVGFNLGLYKGSRSAGTYFATGAARGAAAGGTAGAFVGGIGAVPGALIGAVEGGVQGVVIGVGKDAAVGAGTAAATRLYAECNLGQGK